MTRNFFNIVGLPPEIGRTFSEDEDKVGAPPVAVISDRLWRRVFNADPSVLGRSITLHDQNFTVIGVMPPQVTSPQDSDVWLSMMRRSNNPVWMQRFIHPMIYVWGKLKPGVTLEQARTEMKGPSQRDWKKLIRKQMGTEIADRHAAARESRRQSTGLISRFSWARSVWFCSDRLRELGQSCLPPAARARAREFAIHAAVGATRGQIVKKLLIESFVIALLGGRARLFPRDLGARWFDRLESRRRFAISPNFFRSSGARFHISGRFAHHCAFGIVACLACIAR